jgi:hypothetical protein
MSTTTRDGIEKLLKVDGYRVVLGRAGNDVPFALPHVHDASGMGNLKAGVEESLPVVGSTGGF